MTGGIDYGIENHHCGRIGTLYSRRPDLSQDQKPEEVIQRGRLCGAALYISQKDERSVIAMRERFEQRLFRIFAQAGYSPVQLLTITPEEMVEIPGITVPNIRAVLCVQNKVLADRNKVRSGKLVEALLKEAEESGCCHE